MQYVSQYIKNKVWRMILDLQSRRDDKSDILVANNSKFNEEDQNYDIKEFFYDRERYCVETLCYLWGTEQTVSN